MGKIQAQYQLMEPIGAIWGQNKLQCCSVGIVTIWHYRAEWKFKCESTAFADQLCSWHPFRVSHLHLLEKYERELREKYERGLRDSKFHFDCLLSGCHRTNPHQQAKRLFFYRDRELNVDHDDGIRSNKLSDCQICQILVLCPFLSSFLPAHRGEHMI